MYGRNILRHVDVHLGLWLDGQMIHIILVMEAHWVSSEYAARRSATNHSPDSHISGSAVHR